VKKFLLSYGTFFVAKFHKTENYFLFELLKKEKKLGRFSKNYRTFCATKLSLSSQKYGFGIRDPVSGKKPIPDPGSRGQKGTGSRIRIRNTGAQAKTRVRDPEPAFHLTMDPDPDPAPDPAPLQIDGNLRRLVYTPSRAPF
jgi:hypothetical protein